MHSVGKLLRLCLRFTSTRRRCATFVAGCHVGAHASSAGPFFFCRFAELTAEFMDNALEVDDKLDSLKHVSYKWKQPLNTPL